MNHAHTIARWLLGALLIAAMLSVPLLVWRAWHERPAQQPCISGTTLVDYCKGER